MHRIAAIILAGLAGSLSAGPAAGQSPVSAPKTQQEYAAIFLAGQKVGYCETTETRDAKQVRTGTKMELTIGRGEQAIHQTVETDMIETADGEPVSFRHRMVMGSMPQETIGRIEDGTLHLEITLGEKTTRRTIDWPDGAVLTHGAERISRRAGLKPGTRFSVLLFEPGSLQAMDVKAVVGEPVDVDILGAPRRLIPVSQTVQGPGGTMQMRTFVDEQGEVCKTIASIMGMELTQVVCDRAFALSPAESVVDFTSKVLIPVGKRLDFEGAERAWYWFSPLEGKGKLTLPSLGPQRVVKYGDDSIVLVRAERLEDLAGPLPWAGNDADLKKSLAPARYIQSDDPTIRELSKKAIGDATTAAQAAANIRRFVHEHITAKDLSVGFASALDVARARQGDCTEHAVLTVALCRAAGIPARIAYGLIYIEQFQGRQNILGPHAWALAWVDGRWVTLDAAVLAAGPRRVILSTGLGDEADFWSILGPLDSLQFRTAGVGSPPRNEPAPIPHKAASVSGS